MLPTRLPREEFYQHYAALYQQPDARPYFDLAHQGVLTIEDVKSGFRMIQAMGQWEFYAENDPVLRPAVRRDAMPQDLFGVEATVCKIRRPETESAAA